MDTRKIRRGLSLKKEVKQMRAFLSRKAPLGQKFIDAIVSKYKNNDEDSAEVLELIRKCGKDMSKMLVNNFNNDTEYAINPLQKLHYEAPVLTFDSNKELVRTGWTRKIGGRIAEYCVDYDGSLINQIDITDMIKNNDVCRHLILGFNTGKVKTGFFNNGEWCSLKAETVINNIINTSRANIGKMLAMAYIIDQMKNDGYIPLCLKTGYWSPFYEGTYVRFSSEDGDVPADRIVLPFVRIEDWDTLNARTSNFFGTIAEHTKFMFSNAEKHNKYLSSDYYDIRVKSHVIVMNLKDIKDETLRDMFAKCDGHCVAHYRNAAIIDANKQIIKSYRDMDCIDREGVLHHMLGRHNFAMQIRGSVDTVIEGTAPKAAHMPKGVMSLWKDREWNNIVTALIASNPELEGKITKDTIIMTEDVGKKIPGGEYIMNIRINSFEYDKNDTVANVGYLANTRLMPIQMLFEGIRLYVESNGKLTIDQIMATISDSKNMNNVVKRGMSGYQKMIDRLLKRSGIEITPEEAYNNLNDLLNDIANNKVVEDINEDSNDARFLGFNEMLVILQDISLTLSMIGRKHDIEHFDDFYCNMLEAAIRSAFRVKLTTEKCGFVRRGYLIPHEICIIATNGEFKLNDGEFIVGKNLTGNCEYAVIYRQPIVWTYGAAIFKQSKLVLKTKSYDISYIGGFVINFGALKPSGFQADFDGDTVYGIDAFSFFKHDKNDHIKYNSIVKFYDAFWKRIIPNAIGHSEYVMDGIGIDDDICFNLAHYMADTKYEIDKTPAFTNIIATKLRNEHIHTYDTMMLNDAITEMTFDILDIEISDVTKMITSTMYRESLGQSIGLGDTRFSIATSIIANKYAESMINVALFDKDLEKFGELDNISARMAAYLQSMIGAIKHNDKPLISVDKASYVLAVDAAIAIGTDASIIGLGDVLGRIRKGRLNKFTGYEVKTEGDYKYKSVDFADVANDGLFAMTHHFSHLDRMVLESAARLNGYKLSLHTTYETVVAADCEALTGAVGGVLVQKLLGGSSFDEFNKVLYPDNHMHINASNRDAVYNLPHRMTLAHAIVNYVGTISRVADDSAKIGTASVIKILRDRILATIKFFGDMQKTNNATYNMFLDQVKDKNLYDVSADYFRITGIGNKAPVFEDLISRFGIVVDEEFTKKYDAINAKVSNGHDLTDDENALWLEMQLRINDALPSNIKTFNGVFGALINKKNDRGTALFRDEVYMYSNNDKFEDVVSQMATAKSGPHAWNHRKMLFGLDNDMFTFELMSSLFVMAATSGNKSLFMLLGTRLTKFFIDLYGVEFVGANRINDKIVPMQVIEYEDAANVTVSLVDATVDENGKSKYVYALKYSGECKPDMNMLSTQFADVRADGDVIYITCWYKHISGLMKKLADINIHVKEADNDDHVP